MAVGKLSQSNPSPLFTQKRTRAKCGRRLSRFPQTARFHHPSRGGNQLQTYPQADEELLLAARHHAAVVEHWADLLQGLGSKRRGLVAEDVNLSALQPRVRENMAGLEEGTGAQYGRLVLETDLNLRCTRKVDNPFRQSK